MPDATQNLKLKITADTAQMSGGTGAMANLAMAIGGVTAALYAAKTAYKNFIEPVIQYNKEMKDASDSTGMAVEELSRFVQVGDDMGVSMGGITKALEMGTKNGFAPSIDALADLADLTNAMEDPTEKAATLAKIFGRNWAELNPILQLGGQRIREMAAAQADGLVVTEEEILKTEELRLGLDELNDNWIALRNNLVLGVTPALIEATEKQTFWQAAAGVIARSTQELIPVLKDDFVPTLYGVAGAADDVTDSLEDLATQPPWTAAALAALSTDPAIRATVDELVAIARAADDAYSSLKRMEGMLKFQFTKEEREQGGQSSGGGEQEGYALGGEVGTGGNAYMVGEHGAERFTPKVPGTISPSRDQLATSIDRMVKALPTILIDAIERAK